MKTLISWRFLLGDIEAMWKPWVVYDEEKDCEVVQCPNVKEVNQCLLKQFDILRKLDDGLVEELESHAKVMIHKRSSRLYAKSQPQDVMICFKEAV